MGVAVLQLQASTIFCFMMLFNSLKSANIFIDKLMYGGGSGLSIFVIIQACITYQIVTFSPRFTRLCCAKEHLEGTRPFTCETKTCLALHAPEILILLVSGKSRSVE